MKGLHISISQMRTGRHRARRVREDSAKKKEKWKKPQARSWNPSGLGGATAEVALSSITRPSRVHASCQQWKESFSLLFPSQKQVRKETKCTLKTPTIFLKQFFLHFSPRQTEEVGRPSSSLMLGLALTCLFWATMIQASSVRGNKKRNLCELGPWKTLWKRIWALAGWNMGRFRAQSKEGRPLWNNHHEVQGQALGLPRGRAFPRDVLRGDVWLGLASQGPQSKIRLNCTNPSHHGSFSWLSRQ